VGQHDIGLSAWCLNCHLGPALLYRGLRLQWYFQCCGFCCCAGITQLGSRSVDIDGNVTYSYSTSPIPQAQCDAAAANMIKHLNSYNSTILNMLASQRLGDLKTTGKFAQRGSVASTLRTFLANQYPELVGGIYVDPKGADASDTAGATLDALTSLFVESSLYLVTGAPASLALYRRRLTGVSACAGSFGLPFIPACARSLPM